MALTRPRAVFLDKDGTIIPDIPYNADPARIDLAPGAAEGLAALHRAGFRLVVVSNQSGVARGYFPESALEAVTARLAVLFARAGAELAGAYYCCHLPAATLARYRLACGCRKPSGGLIREAATELGIDLDGSWFIGDILDDVQAGRSCGLRTVLIDNGNETEWLLSPERLPHHVAADLAESARIILALAARPAALPLEAAV